MKKKLLLFIFILPASLFSPSLRAQSVSITLDYDGAQSLGCCDVCGDDYICFGGSCGCCIGTGTLNFTDPVPPGNIITGVNVTYYGVDCGGAATSIPSTINGTAVGTTAAALFDCSCGNCYAYPPSATTTFPCTGVAGYNYGGSNTLQPSPTDVVCMDHVIITFDYVPNTSFALPPIGAITGPANGCSGTTGVYSVPAVAGATTYTWTVPGGTVINSGQGTTSIDVTYGSTSGNICVTASSACDTEGPACFAVTMNAIPVVNPEPDLFYCHGDAVPTNSFSSFPGGATFQWTNSNTAIGLGSFGPGGLPAFTATNLTAAPISGTITVTPSLSGCYGPVETFVITINYTPVMTPEPDLVYCNGDPVPINSFVSTPAGATFNWTNSNTAIGLTASGVGSTPAFTATNTSGGPISGTITVTPIAGMCTGANDVFTITVNPNPSFALAFTDPTICGASDGTITINGLMASTNYSVTYNDDGVPVGPAVMMSDGAGNIVISGLNAGSYSNFILTLGACSTTDASVLVLSDSNPPTVGAGPDQTICAGDPVTLTASNPDGAVISWDNAVTDGISFSPGSTLTYTVTADLAGCLNTDQVVVTVNPLPTVGAGADQTVCTGTPVTLTASNPDGAAITWDNAVNDGVAFTPGATLTYTVTADLSGCLSTDQVIVTLNTVPTVGAGPDQTVCMGTAATLTASNPNGALISWDNAVNDGVAFTPASTLTYTVTANLAGCISTDQVIVTVNPMPVIGAGTDQAVCAGTPVTLTASNPDGAVLSWDNGVTDSNPFNPAATTIYTVTGDLAGCISTDQVTVVVNALPAIAANANPGINLCIGDAVTLSGSGGISYSWTGGVTDGVSFVAATTTTYTVTGTDGNGCQNTDDITLTIVNCELPVAMIGTSGSPSTICVDDCINFQDLSTGLNINTWEWNLGAGGITSSVPNPATMCYGVPGTYTITLTVTNDVGPDTETFTLTVIECIPPTAIFTLSDSVICLGECITLTDQSLEEPTSWVWAFDGALSPNTTTEQNPVICPTELGTFDIELTVTNPFGQDVISHPITVNVVPVVSAGYDTTIEMNTAVQLGAAVSPGGGAFTWSFNDGDNDDIDCPTCDSTLAYPVFTETYQVVYVTEEGCSATDEVLVTVLFEDFINVPNGFSPNGDNNNEILFVKGEGVIDMQFVIYNRYGQKVFESYDQNIGWDGYLNGKPENPGVFVWYLDYTLVDGSRNSKKGNVTLIK